MSKNGNFRYSKLRHTINCLFSLTFRQLIQLRVFHPVSFINSSLNLEAAVSYSKISRGYSFIHSSSAASSDDNASNYSRPRKCYLFCEHNNLDRLFEELDKKTGVPLIPKFKEYVLSEQQKRDILKPLQVISNRENFDVWLLTLTENEKNVIEVVNEGLRSGAISIPNSNGKIFPEVHSVTQYLNTFGVLIAERIKNQFQPLFDPATETLSPEILAVNENIKNNVGYSIYDAQLAVCEAHKRCLEKKKATLCIAECGSGKTKICITSLHAYQQRNAQNNHPLKHFNIIFSHRTLCGFPQLKIRRQQIQGGNQFVVFKALFICLF